jgi:O-antigen ligase
LLLSVPFLRRLRQSQVPAAFRLVVVLMIALGGVGFVVLQYAQEALTLLGRDETFSGRTDIWEAAIRIGMQQPILGTGYRTFYTSGLTNRVLIGNGHNSFLDLWLELGTVGFGLFIATMFVAIRRALHRLVTSKDRRGMWFIMYIIFMILFGMAAQVFPDHGTIPWVLYILTYLYLTPMVPEQRLGSLEQLHVAPPPRGAPAAAE